MDYFSWHYLYIYPKLFTVFFHGLIFPFYFFSVPIHLLHLFSPWKRVTVHKKKGFFIEDILGVIFFNLTSRILGAIVRLFTVLSALLLSFILLPLLLALLIFWPVLIGFSYPLFISRKKNFSQEAENLAHARDLPQLMEKFCQTSLGKFILLRLGFYDKEFILLIRKNAVEGKMSPWQQVKELLKIFYDYQPIQRILTAKNIRLEDLYSIFRWFELNESLEQKPLLLSRDRIKNLPGLGYDWHYGYTPIVDNYALEITNNPSPYPFLLGRDKEINEMERILLKSENNNCLVYGEPGVARHLLIETLAHHLVSGKTSKELADKRILSLDMHALTGGGKNLSEIKALFSDILSEALSAGNIIIFIDDIDKYLSSGEGRLDLTDVIEKFARSRVGVLGITTTADFRNFIQPNSTLAKLFDEVVLSPPSKELLLDELLLSIVPVLEKKHRCLITYPAVVKTIEDADKYITQTPFPQKAIELLEEVIIYLRENKEGHLITEDVVDKVLSLKLNMPLGDIGRKEEEKLKNLEDYLHRRLINQNQAVRLIASSLRRSRLNVSSKEKPIGSFLFLGPTGVGKTETAKALSEVYFGSEDRLQRFDMSQYQSGNGIDKLIGNAKNKSAGDLTSKLKETPYAVLLFDEIEKADQTVLNLLLTLLDEGYLVDGFSKKIDFRQTIIIATSNAGAEFIREKLVSGITAEDIQSGITDFILKERFFSPEFINRFDSVVVYTPLSHGHLKEVTRLMLNNLNKRLAKREIKINISDELVNYLSGAGQSREFGARAIRREIETKVEDYLAQKLLNEKVEKGQEITVDPTLLT